MSNAKEWMNRDSGESAWTVALRSHLKCHLPKASFSLESYQPFAVWSEPVLDTPQDGVGALGNTDTAVAATNKGLDGVA